MKAVYLQAYLEEIDAVDSLVQEVVKEIERALGGGAHVGWVMR